MSTENVRAEYGMQDTAERIQYPEFNDLNRKNEFNEKYYSCEYNSPVCEYSDTGKKAPSRRSRKRLTLGGLPLLETVAASVAALTILVAALFFPLAVRILSDSVGTDSLRLELNVRNKSQVPLSALLFDENGDFVAEQTIQPENQREILLFDGLNADCVYSFRVVRKDTDGVVTEKSYRTEALPPKADFVLTPDEESVDYFALSLFFLGEGEEPSAILGTVNGAPAEITKDGERFVLFADGLSEGQSASVTVTDGDTGKLLFEGNYVTPLTPAAKAEEQARTVRADGAEFTITLANPYGHRLSAAVEGGTFSETTDGAGNMILSVTGLSEGTEYSYTVTDLTRETLILSEKFTTSMGSDAFASLEDRTVTYCSADLSFLVNDPYGHGIIAVLNGSRVLFEMTGTDSGALHLENLQDRTIYTVVLQDSVTGSEILQDVFLTPEAPDAAVRLASSEIDYFTAKLTFTVDNPSGHELKAFLGNDQVPFTVKGTSAVLELADLSEKTSYLVRILDAYDGMPVYSAPFTTKATPSANVTLSGTPFVSYFEIGCSFAVDNPYGHELKLVLDNGPEEPFTVNPEWTSLSEGTAYTVSVLDKITGETVFQETVTTLTAGSVSARLQTSEVNYFDAKLIFTVSNPAGHGLKAYVNDGEKPFAVSGSAGTLSLTGLSEKTDYRVRIEDTFTHAAVYVGTFTTKATPSAAVSLSGSPSPGYFSLNLNFAVNNPYGHQLRTVFDGGPEQTFSASSEFTGLSEGSTHTVKVLDKNTGATVFSQTFTTLRAGNASVTLKNASDQYTSAALTFDVSNPAGHGLSAYLGNTKVSFVQSGGTGTVQLSGLKEKTSYQVRVVDDSTGNTVCNADFATRETPPATVKLRGSSVSCFGIDLNFTLTQNNYNHTLTVVFDGRSSAFQTKKSYSGLGMMTTHSVTVRDTNPNTGTVTTVYSGSFTTKPPVEITQDTDGKVRYRLEDDFVAAHPDSVYDVTMIAKKSFNPDYDYIWFERDNIGIVGDTGSNFVFSGDYNVEVSLNGVVEFTFEHTLKYGLTICEVQGRLQSGSLTFKVTSGKLPTLNSGEKIVIYLYDEAGGFWEFRSGVDFNYSAGGFSIRLPATPTGTVRPTDFQIELQRHHALYDYDMGIILAMDRIS